MLMLAYRCRQAWSVTRSSFAPSQAASARSWARRESHGRSALAPNTSPARRPLRSACSRRYGARAAVIGTFRTLRAPEGPRRRVIAALHGEAPSLEIDVAPLDAEQFTATQPSEHGDRP